MNKLTWAALPALLALTACTPTTVSNQVDNASVRSSAASVVHTVHTALDKGGCKTFVVTTTARYFAESTAAKRATTLKNAESALGTGSKTYTALVSVVHNKVVLAAAKSGGVKAAVLAASSASSKVCS